MNPHRVLSYAYSETSWPPPLFSSHALCLLCSLHVASVSEIQVTARSSWILRWSSYWLISFGLIAGKQEKKISVGSFFCPGYSAPFFFFFSWACHTVDLRTNQKGVVEKPGAGIISLGRHLLDGKGLLSDSCFLLENVYTW